MTSVTAMLHYTFNGQAGKYAGVSYRKTGFALFLRNAKTNLKPSTGLVENTEQ